MAEFVPGTLVEVDDEGGRVDGVIIGVDRYQSGKEYNGHSVVHFPCGDYTADGTEGGLDYAMVDNEGIHLIGEAESADLSSATLPQLVAELAKRVE